MANYDYETGIKRVEEILDSKIEINDVDSIPSEENFTYSNAYIGWVTGIFVDIRNSTKLFTENSKTTVAKIIRSFTPEIIEVLRKDDNLREIGIRGDCVYAVYTTPKKSDILEIADKSFYINTYMKMLNKMLLNRNMPTIRVGIGVSTSKDLVIKAGRMNSGINSAVWIGKAVTLASNLSSLGNKNEKDPIVFSKLCYDNFIDDLCKRNSNKDVLSWFCESSSSENGTYYYADIVKEVFSDWVDENV